jgi:hypothetical protein
LVGLLEQLSKAFVWKGAGLGRAGAVGESCPADTAGGAWIEVVPLVMLEVLERMLYNCSCFS